MSAFTVSNAKVLRKNSLIGFFDLQMPSGMIVRGAMLFEKNGRRWIGLPSREWVKSDGSKSYSPIIEFASREVADKFQAVVLPLAEQELAHEERR